MVTTNGFWPAQSMEVWQEQPICAYYFVKEGMMDMDKVREFIRKRDIISFRCAVMVLMLLQQWLKARSAFCSSVRS